MKHDDSKGCREYESLSRRQFLTDTGKVAFLAATAPAWLPKVSYAQDYVSNRDVIVSIYLRGGCDGLTMCVPHGDADYYAARPTLAVPVPESGPNACVDLNGFFGLPQHMLPLHEAYLNGDLAIVHATGSTDPSRSHFDAQRFMEVGLPGASALGTGWLGRHLASVPPVRPDAALRAVGINYGLPLTLSGGPLSLPIPNLDAFGMSGYETSRVARSKTLGNIYQTDALLTQIAYNTQKTITLLDQIDFAGYQPSGGAVYPANGFGTAIKSTAALIKADTGVEAVHLDLGGWDTHAAQGVFTGAMANLMTTLAGSLSAFHKDVFTDYSGKVVVVVVSEFGRVLYENASSGTDHGHGNVIIVIGHAVNGGTVYSQWPGLKPHQLFAGRSLEVTIDFRDVLGEVVSKRLGNPNLDVVFPSYTPTFRGICQA